MAEAFGIAAGAIGVVSITIQLANSLEKVKDFCATVRNAPSQVAELIEEIEMLQNILSDLKGGCLSVNIASLANMRRCLEVAQRATKRLVSLSDGLQIKLKKSKFRGGARFALSRDEMKHMLHQLERMKSSLILAYSIHREAMADERYSGLMQAVKGSEATSTQTMHTRAMLAKCSEPVTCTCNELAASLYTRKLRAGKKLIQLTTPTWASNTIWQLEMRRSIFGLNIFTRTYGIVPRDAPIFHSCRYRDDAEMQRLFDSGQASPFDQDERGSSLWVLAIAGGCIKTLRCLSQYSAAPAYHNFYEATSLFIFHTSATLLAKLRGAPLYTRGQDLREDMMWLRDICDSDDDDESPGDDYARSSHTGAMQLLLCPPSHANSVWFWQILEIPPDTHFLLDVVSQTPAEDMLDCFLPEHHGGKTPIQILAVNGAWHLARDVAEALSAIEKITGCTIARGADIHDELHRHTPLFLFLETLIMCPSRAQPFVAKSRDLRRWLLWWLKILQDAGLDLVVYGAEEVRRFRILRSTDNSSPRFECWFNLIPSEYLGQVLHFTVGYGPTPEDWTVQVEFPVEQYVSDFWQIPSLQDDGKSLSIPGSWIDFQ